MHPCLCGFPGPKEDARASFWNPHGLQKKAVVSLPEPLEPKSDTVPINPTFGTASACQYWSFCGIPTVEPLYDPPTSSASGPEGP